jgi:hypothetical protein
MLANAVCCDSHSNRLMGQACMQTSRCPVLAKMCFVAQDVV